MFREGNKNCEVVKFVLIEGYHTVVCDLVQIESIHVFK